MQQPAFTLVDEPEACRILGNIHRATLHRGIAARRFPKPLKIGPGSNRWRDDELYAVLARADAARSPEAA
ncbi:hypothetical protein CK218_22225 [Mesorhizobium sp. WSM3879]|nr:hypothetical protein CK218_22225 [Mesorhizobium sp. WSM3879]